MCVGEEITDVLIARPLHILAFIKKTVLSPRREEMACHKPWASQKEEEDKEMLKGGHIFSLDIIFVSFY